MSITIHVKATNGDKHAVGTEKTALVSEFKDAIAEKTSIPANQQRLIYKGVNWRCLFPSRLIRLFHLICHLFYFPIPSIVLGFQCICFAYFNRQCVERRPFA
jgi:hypothetical protein